MYLESAKWELYTAVNDCGLIGEEEPLFTRCTEDGIFRELAYTIAMDAYVHGYGPKRSAALEQKLLKELRNTRRINREITLKLHGESYKAPIVFNGSVGYLAVEPRLWQVYVVKFRRGDY